MCRIQWFLAICRSFFHSYLLYTFSCHPSPSTILPSSLTSSCAIYCLVYLSILFFPNSCTLLGILFSSILCMCPNQHNLIILYLLYGIWKIKVTK
jgi:hypothetical protein